MVVGMILIYFYNLRIKRQSIKMKGVSGSSPSEKSLLYCD